MTQRKTVVLEKMELSDNNPSGQLRMTDKVLETKSFDERNAEQVLKDAALAKQWRRKAVQPKEFNPTVVKTIVENDNSPMANEEKAIEVISRLRSTDDIGYLQSVIKNDQRESVVNAAKARLKRIS